MRNKEMKTKKWKITKTTKTIAIFVVALLLIDLYIFNGLKPNIVVVEDNLPVYTSSELVKYDGSDIDKPIYLALDGFVYDVSDGRNDFYAPGEAYHELVGKDSSALLSIFGGDIIRKKYRIVGVYKQ